MQLEEDTLSMIQEEIFDRYEFGPHSHVVEHDYLKAYYHLSIPVDNTNPVTNDDKLSAIIPNVVNDA